MISANLPAYSVAAPLLMAVVVNLLGGRRAALIPPLAMVSLGISTLCAAFLLPRVLRDGPLSYTMGGWEPPWGIELIVDPLSALMLLLVSAVALVATWSAGASVAKDMPGREHHFFALYLILISGLLALTMTGDTFNLYVMLEITAITTYGLIAMGRERAPLASFNYIIMGTIGACFLLLGTGYLYILTGSLNMVDIGRILPELYGGAAVATAFAFLMVGIWIKTAFFPLHSWLPNAYTYAPSGTSVLIAPLMTKVSVYLMIRLIYTVYSPEYAFVLHPAVPHLIVWAAAIGIFIASSLALAQVEFKKMLTYIVVAEVGYMVGAVWLINEQALTGAVLHIVNDALMTLCLFLVASAVVYQQGSCRFEDFRGLYRRMPWTMAAFTVGAFSMIGIPPTAGFFSKWYLILGGIEAGQYLYVAALVFSSLVNAILFFRIIEIAFFDGADQALDANGRVIRAEAPGALVQPLLLTAVALIVVGLSAGPLVSGVIVPALAWLH
ncbi:complex I subunit 5 family protein [Geoalkalibacter halelectricus]|uniref:complex I subunit 5 family protein n=1 Tax=Geoalkalibacter halelectricus TaxID=2847045 RepID=UPI003D23FFDD